MEPRGYYDPPSAKEPTPEEWEEFLAKQPSIEFSTGWWNGPIIPLSSDYPFGDLERLVHSGIHVTNITPPAQGWPVATYCPICKETTFILSPWAMKPLTGDYFKMNGVCGRDERHNLDMAMKPIHKLEDAL